MTFPGIRIEHEAVGSGIGLPGHGFPSADKIGTSVVKTDIMVIGRPLGKGTRGDIEFCQFGVAVGTGERFRHPGLSRLEFLLAEGIHGPVLFE